MDPQARDQSKLVPRFWFCLLFTVPFFLRRLDPWLQWLLATIVLVVGAYPFIRQTIAKKMTSYTLVSLGLALAYFYSVLEFFFSAAPTFYFEQTACITLFVIVGMLIDAELIEQAFQPLRSLHSLAPKKALKLFPDGHEEEVAIDNLAKNDSVRIRPKEIIPVDGVIFSGRAVVDESLLSADHTGVEKTFGDAVFAGTRNLQETYLVRATHVGSDTYFAKILKIVDQASGIPLSELPAALFFWAVAGLATFCFLVWSLFAGLASGISVACTLLIVASPRAFAATTVVLNQVPIIGAMAGIVIRARDTVQHINRVDTLVFEKIAAIEPLRKGVKEAIGKLKSEGLQLFCLSSEPRTAVVELANALGLDRFQAEASLEQKLATLQKLQKKGNCLALLGDPEKDAALLQQADVGIAMGPKALMTKIKTPVILLKSDLQGVVRLFSLVHTVNQRYRQNLFLAYAYHITVLTLATFGGISLLYGAGFMVLSTVLIEINSLRLKAV